GYSGSLPFPTGNIVKSTNSGLNWFSQYNNGIAVNTALTSLYFINENTGWIIGLVNAIYKTTNGGLNYFPQTVEGDWNECFFMNQNTGWIIGQFGLTGRALKTTNGGINWIEKLNYDTQTFGSINFLNDSIGFIAGGNGLVLKTTNSGNNWSESHIYNPIGLRSLSFPTVDVGFVAGRQGKIFKTLNNGSNWSIISDNMGHYVNSLRMINVQSGYLAGGFEYTSGVIKATNDGGLNWYEQYSTNLELKSISFINANTGYCVGLNGQILKTTNGGGALGITQLSAEHPEKFTLSQNYPNPFNPATKIRFSVPKQSLVKLSIYDILGKEINVLTNDFLQAGTYETDFDASHLSSGIYFYSLSTTDFTETKKMVLIK
ncbi:MAG TPA: YCF48-related protein, partial [Ignavibacteria bacterium]|nr:YCF48-related protein [Ignavibacteria bacterium]